MKGILCIVSSKRGEGGRGLILTSPSTSAKAMSLREFVPLVGNICDLSIVVAVNILLLEL